MSTQFDAIVQAVIHDWPDYGWSGQLEAAIKQLYLSDLSYPATWSSETPRGVRRAPRRRRCASSHHLVGTISSIPSQIAMRAITEFSPIVTMRPCFSKRRDETQSTNWSSASWLTYLPRSPR